MSTVEASVSGKVHLLIAWHYVRLACSPPWVDSRGRMTVQSTFILEHVTCGSCRRSKAFKLAEAILNGAIRDQAVREVDARHGYTMEFAPSPEAHAAEYDKREEEIIASRTPTSRMTKGTIEREKV